MATTKSMQFDGTLGSAKAICAWIGDPKKANAGPGYVKDDSAQGGLDLIGKDERGGTHYTTVKATDYVVKSGDDYVVFSAAQHAAAFPKE